MAMTMEQIPGAMGPEEVGKRLGITKTAAARKMGQGEIPGAYPIGASSYRVDPDDLEKYIASLKQQASKIHAEQSARQKAKRERLLRNKKEGR